MLVARLDHASRISTKQIFLQGQALYADDSALVFSHSDPAVISERLGSELSLCRSWLIDNRLSLHMGKTECILFGTAHRLKRVGDF